MDMPMKEILKIEEIEINFPAPPFLSVETCVKLSDRELFYTLINLDENVSALPAAFHKARGMLMSVPDIFRSKAEVGAYVRSDIFHKITEEIELWRDELLRFHGQRFKDLSDAGYMHLLKQYAPAAAVDGCWLQNASKPINSHTSLSAALLKLHVQRTGYGNNSHNLGNCFSDLLRNLGIYLPDSGTSAFSTSREFFHFAFAIPTFEQAISQFPETFLPEILGYSLFKSIYGCCPILNLIGKALNKSVLHNRYFEIYQDEPLSKEAYRIALSALDLYLRAVQESHPDQRLIAEQRVLTGIDCGIHLIEIWLRELMAISENGAFTPHAEMVALINRKAPHAYGYHKKKVLNGRSVDEWFAPGEVKAEEFVNLLARSAFVRPGKSEESPLLTKLIAFGGPMFRIFSESELKIIARWIDSLPHNEEIKVANTLAVGGTVDRDAAVASISASLTQRFAAGKPIDVAANKKYSQMDLREIYYYLLTYEQHPDVLFFAKSFTKDWLSRAAVGLHKGKQAIPFAEYTASALDEWLDQQHRRQVDSYRPTGGPPDLAKEEVIHSSVQLCPMVFIDGGWLQRAGDAAFCRSEIGSLLYQIYMDEVGNGQIELNHPNVYRALMAEMEVPVPPFGTKEFSAWGGFDDAAFQVPVFWLCISQFPKHFLPELLGLNLAMELSGVGGSYRSGSDALKYYGFNTLFVDLHNTIDNVSSGHTAMASHAIKIHMDEMLAKGGRKEVQRQWLRVWTGYRALTPPNGFKRSLFAKARSVLSRSVESFVNV